MSRFRPPMAAFTPQTPPAGRGREAATTMAPAAPPALRAPVTPGMFSPPGGPLGTPMGPGAGAMAGPLMGQMAGAPPQQPVVLPAAPHNPVSTAGYFALATYFFALFGFLTEISTEILGFKPYLSMVMGPLALVFAVLSGNFERLRSPLITITSFFLFWLAASVPFSYFRGGSIAAMQDILFRSYSIIYLSAILLTTMGRVRMVFSLLAGTCVIMQLVCQFYGVYGPDGRLILSFGSLSNANDLATHLLTLLPFCLFSLFTSRLKFLVRPVMAICAMLVLLTVIKTGSRGALLALAAMLLVIVVLGNNQVRGAVVAGGVLALALAVVLVPGLAWQRLMTTVVADVGEEDTSYAIASRESRRELVRRAILVTLQRPIFGVGPGNFGAYAAREDMDAGRRAGWQGTHNAYLQISSEAGIPALVLMVVLLVASVRVLLRIHRAAAADPRLSDLRWMALSLLTALVGLCVNLTFANIAYRFYIPGMIGLVVALYWVANQALTQLQLAKAAAAIAPAPGAPGRLGAPAWQMPR